VNGLDLSGASHNEAVEAFRQAKEPIIVQVVRQSALNQQTTTATMHRQATVGGPTMIPPPPTKPLPRVPQPADGEAAPCCRLPASQRSQPPAAQARCPTTSLQHVAPPQLTPPPVPPFPAQLMRCGLFTQASSSSEAKTPDAEDDEFYNNVDDEFDYEEVVLCRSSAAEKLGLTLCYSSMDGGSSESPTEVFVSEVERAASQRPAAGSGQATRSCASTATRCGRAIRPSAFSALAIVGLPSLWRDRQRPPRPTQAAPSAAPHRRRRRRRRPTWTSCTWSS
uniref:PDZ domain-containing protein n=1 Tax=Macrostomum lignano TaxID=282301 RepID=A0A1I8IWJ7_9PLAT